MAEWVDVTVYRDEFRSAYLYARNNGCNDEEGSLFADFFVGSHFTVVELPAEFHGWLDRREAARVGPAK